ncbi:MAG: translation initiation factor eIF-1A [Nanoarchaeota archaeon]
MADDKYGEFEEVIDESKQGPVVPGSPDTGFVRVRLPRKGELIGIIIQRYGGNRMDVKSSDGKSRNCRVPGRFKRSLWLRPNDFVLITPWVDDDEKGDVIFKYQGGQINLLRKKGLLDNLSSGF